MVKIESKLLLQPIDFRPSFKGWNVEGVLNPGAIRLPNKKIMLIVRLAEMAGKKHLKLERCPVISTEEDFKEHFGKIHSGKIFKMSGNVIQVKQNICRLTTISHFRKVILSEDGFNVEEIYQSPFFVGREGDGDYGVEDPRIVKIGDKYIMTYVTINENEGVCISLAVSKDLNKWDRKGIIFNEQNKDAFLFPNKIKGKYVAINRPEGFFEFSKPSIWISYSPDLIHWGEGKSIIQPRKNSWDKDRVGGGAPPIKTKKGWLMIYHGVKKGSDKSVYSAGFVLFDLKDPSKVIARTPKEKPLIIPFSDYEQKGFINDVVFPTGIVPTLDGKSLLIYSGGADSVVTVKKVTIKDIFQRLKPVKKKR